jgi:hypothetical protein
VPYFDPTTDVFTFDGKSFNVNDNRVFRARFEKYLNSEAATSEMDTAYRMAIREILDTLSPHNRDAKKFPKAVAQLQRASQFPQDARLCESLANAVYRVYLAQRNQSTVEAAQQRTRPAAPAARLELRFAWSDGDAGTRERKLSDDPSNQEPAATEPANAGHIQRYVQRIAEVEAERVANAAKVQLSELEAKLEFQALVVQFFLQRRFEHVVMATRFYTEFFKDGDGKLQFEEGSEVEQSFAKTIGFNPTITTLDAFANEAIRDVGQSVESFGFLMDSGKTDGALRQLQQAFVMGEHLPPVQSVPREKKTAILDYAENSFQLVNAIEVKDYGLAEELVNKMKVQAGDFDYSKPTAAIEAAKLSSNMRIRTAKNAALQGDNDAYEVEHQGRGRDLAAESDAEGAVQPHRRLGGRAAAGEDRVRPAPRDPELPPDFHGPGPLHCRDGGRPRAAEGARADHRQHPGDRNGDEAGRHPRQGGQQPRRLGDRGERPSSVSLTMSR